VQIPRRQEEEENPARGVVYTIPSLVAWFRLSEFLDGPGMSFEAFHRSSLAVERKDVDGRIGQSRQRQGEVVGREKERKKERKEEADVMLPSHRQRVRCRAQSSSRSSRRQGIRSKVSFSLFVCVLRSWQ
jgi:hypothetical protein